MLWRVLLGMDLDQPQHGEDHLIKCHVGRLLDMGRWKFAVVEVHGPTKGISRLHYEVPSRFPVCSGTYPESIEVLFFSI